MVYGASGYTSGELLRLLQVHPNVLIVGVVSQSSPDTSLSSLHGNLSDELGELKTIRDAQLPSCDCVFFATPAGVAMDKVSHVLGKNTKVVDLSPDFRIKDIKLWQKYYGMVHNETGLVADAVYGLPEANREKIRKARLIANPGCYATAVQLGLLPLVENSALREFFAGNEIVVDAKSGVSGAGRKAAAHLLMGEAGEDFTCYAAEGHRHQPEIEQSLQAVGGGEVKIRFVPHLLPVTRGIFTDIYLPLLKSADNDLKVTQAQGKDRIDSNAGDSQGGNSSRQMLEAMHRSYQHFYAKHPFVKILPLGTAPRIKNTRGSNYCHISLFAAPDSTYIQVCAVLDNLVKGAAGQAIQNMNLAFGLPETTGLDHTGLAP